MDVEMPMLPSIYELEKLRQSMIVPAQVEQRDDGLFVSRSLHYALEKEITHLENKFGNVLHEDGVLIQVMADAASLSRSQKTIMARMHKGEEAEMLKVLHDEMGVFIKEKYVKAPSKNASAKAVEKPHVIGREAETLLDKFHLCVNIVCQHNADEDAESHVDREELTRVWQGLKDVWEALCDFDDDGPGGPKREAKAAEVEELAATYVASFISFTAPEHVTTYMHDLVAHIPSQIRELGDLRLFSGEALEHLHHVNKVTYAHRSNKRVKTGTDKRGRAMGVGARTCAEHACWHGAPRVGTPTLHATFLCGTTSKEEDAGSHAGCSKMSRRAGHAA
eukprot:jgi/Mesvir1/21964/Mv08203-RA.1